MSNLEDILNALDSDQPVLIGLDVFRGFMRVGKENSVVPMPDITEDILGGHAMFALGYSVPDQKLLVKNSFGKRWGDNGYCWLTFDYVRDHVFEKWIFDINDQTTVLLRN